MGCTHREDSCASTPLGGQFSNISQVNKYHFELKKKKNQDPIGIGEAAIILINSNDIKMVSTTETVIFWLWFVAVCILSPSSSQS